MSDRRVHPQMRLPACTDVHPDMLSTLALLLLSLAFVVLLWAICGALAWLVQGAA